MVNLSFVGKLILNLCSGCTTFSKSGKLNFLMSVLFLRFVFGLTALLPLITSAVAVLVREKPVVGPVRGLKQNLPLANAGFLEKSKEDIIMLWGAVKQPNVLLPTLFIFLWQATPQSDSAMFYFT